MLKHYTEQDILHDTKVYLYPNGKKKVIIASRPIFREKGFETSFTYAVEKPVEKPVGKFETVAKRNNNDILRSLRRAKSTVKDIALCNPFTHFVTLTISPEVVSRYDIKEIYSKLKVWLSNKVQRNQLIYVLIPEHHKDGAIHFHGFFGGEIDYIYALTTKDGIDIYNIKDYKLGFTTAIPIYGTYEKAVSYTLKYMTKETNIIGGRWYYSGGKLKKPDIILTDTYNPYGDRVEVQETFSFSVPEINCFFRVYDEVPKF